MLEVEQHPSGGRLEREVDEQHKVNTCTKRSLSPEARVPLLQREKLVRSSLLEAGMTFSYCTLGI